MKRFVALFSCLAALASCGPGQVSATCGPRTHLMGEVCAPDSDLCGAGTSYTMGSCVAARTCGAGTTLDGTQCVAAGGLSCGSGTMAQGTVCIAVALSCGSGTIQQGTQCVPSAAAITCGAGTMLVGDQCVPSATAITCGAGTQLQGTECVPSGTAITCGTGTMLQGTQCVSYSGLSCGAGTTQSGTQCIAVGGGNGTYLVRVPVTTIDADGYSKIPVFTLGTLSSGAASNEAVVLTVSPSYLGTISPAAFNLGTVGTTSYYTPCSSSSSACTGSFVINLALASAPSQVIASTGTLYLVPPTGVGSAAACLVGGNIIFYNGDTGDYIHPGTATITQGNWSASGGTSSVTVHVDPSNAAQGLWWDLEFSTQQLGQPLAVNVYRLAERAPFASPGHPGIDIGGDGRGCNTITGAFQVETITWNGSMLKSFTASFEQHCEGGAAALRGCVHFEQ